MLAGSHNANELNPRHCIQTQLAGTPVIRQWEPPALSPAPDSGRVPPLRRAGWVQVRLADDLTDAQAYRVRKPEPFPKITAVFVKVTPLESVVTHWSVLVPDGVQTTEVTVTPGSKYWPDWSLSRCWT